MIVKVKMKANQVIKNKNYIFYLLTLLCRPWIDNFEALSAAYSYMRCLDNIVDDIHNPSDYVRDLLDREVSLIENMYSANKTFTNCERDIILNKFIRYDISIGCKLKKPFFTMLETLYFDLNRRNSICSKNDLNKYSYKMAHSFVSFMIHFLQIKNQNTDELISLATASCQAYMLRDLYEDMENGLINIDRESFQKMNTDLGNLTSHDLRKWSIDKALALFLKMNGMYKLLSMDARLINRFIFLAFMEPRRYALIKIMKDKHRIRKRVKFSFFDYLKIVLTILYRLTYGGRFHNAAGYPYDTI